MKVLSTILISLCLISSPAQSSDAKKDQSEESTRIGDSLRASRYSNLYFSGQPSHKDWASLKKQGFTHIINFRKASEIDEAKEKKEVEDLGMIYSHMPMDSSLPLTKSKVESVTKAVLKYRKKGKTLIHCGSGNRVAYWVGAHFYLDHKYSGPDAVAMAEKMGLTSSGLKRKLKKFISDNKNSKR